MPVQFKLDWEKAIAALTYLASQNMPELSKGKLCKLLFLADKYHLVRFGRPITGDSYWAVNHGPIPSEIKDRLDALEEGKDRQLADILQLDRSFTYPRVSANALIGMENLSESDRAALDRTVRLFGGLTFAQLRSVTHEMPAYEKAWARRGDANRSPMAFEEFFEEDEEAVVGAFEEMVETDLLNRAFVIR